MQQLSSKNFLKYIFFFFQISEKVYFRPELSMYFQCGIVYIDGIEQGEPTLYSPGSALSNRVIPFDKGRPQSNTFRRF